MEEGYLQQQWMRFMRWVQRDGQKHDDEQAYADIAASLRQLEAQRQTAAVSPEGLWGASGQAPESVAGIGDESVVLRRGSRSVRRSVSRSTVTAASAPVSGSSVIEDVPPSRPGQWLNLPDPQFQARFEVTDRVWPVTVEEPSICLWSQDKLAAFSLTIDDNHISDHPFWLALGDELGWRWTWFLIANQPGWHHEPWRAWQRVLARGHDVQSHSVTHLCDALFYAQKEYRQAKNLINDHVPGANVLTLAYPFGFKTKKDGSPCECIPTLNNRDEAAKHYLAARDVVGALQSPAKIDFMKVPSVSSLRNFFNPDTPWAQFDTVLDADSPNWRAWYCGHMHHVPDEATKQAVRDVMNHLKQHEDDVWVGTFTEVAKYAQEYATATVDNVRLSAGRLQFDLVDEMFDGWYDMPLTVKVRIEPAWQASLQAVQAGQSIPVSVIPYQRALYALVDAVPDRGLVSLTW